MSSPEELQRRGALIKSAREARSWSIAKLAREVGVDRGHMSRIEAGKLEGSLSTFVAACKALDIDLNLLKGEPEQSQVRGV